MGSFRERIGMARVQKKRQAAPRAHAEEKVPVGRETVAAETPTYITQKLAISMDPRRYQQLKAETREKLLDMVDLAVLKEMKKEEVALQIRKVTAQLLEEANVALNQREKDQFSTEMVDEIIGYGPLEPLLRDPAVSDILVNGMDKVYVETEGKLKLSDVHFRSDKHLLQIIDRMVSTVGRHIDEASPMCDARLLDGSRINAVIPPLAIDYPSLSIRKFKRDVLTVDELVGYGSFTRQIAMVFEACVKARLNILISGGTGSGKTTLLNLLSGFIQHDQRIITIEDSAELQLQQPHVLRLETRPPNIEGKGEVNQYDLLRNTLRMRPDRIILGEVRGKEALDMLQAMNTGHDGSMSTVHANTPRDSISRLETMIAMGGLELPQKAMRQQIASAIDAVIQQSRLPDGSRKVTHFTEVLGLEGDMITTQDIFLFDQRGIDPDGKVVGEHVATGVQPHFMQKVKTAGIKLPPELFMPTG